MIMLALSLAINDSDRIHVIHPSFLIAGANPRDAVEVSFRVRIPPHPENRRVRLEVSHDEGSVFNSSTWDLNGEDERGQWEVAYRLKAGGYEVAAFLTTESGRRYAYRGRLTIR